MGLGLLALGAALAATPPLAELKADWARLSALRDEHGQLSATLSESDLVALSQGRMVKHRERIAGPDHAWGVAWSTEPREALWIAILDDTHDTIVEGLREQQLPGTTPDRKLLFQHLDLPWPFEDRQWVLEIVNNPTIYTASGGDIWERVWTLAPESLATDPAPDAIWTPENDGGWLLMEAAGGTLMVYQVRGDIGGAIPDDLVTRYALSTLDDMLDHVMDRAAIIPAHYDAAHFAMRRPDGTDIAPGSLTVSRPEAD